MYNEPPFFDLIFSVLSFFMKDKTKSRVGEGFFSIIFEPLDCANLLSDLVHDMITWSEN